MTATTLEDASPDEVRAAYQRLHVLHLRAQKAVSHWKEKCLGQAGELRRLRAAMQAIADMPDPITPEQAQQIREWAAASYSGPAPQSDLSPP
jgi:hypothetical protein